MDQPGSPMAALGDEQRRTVYSVLVWSALFALGENAITAALVFGSLLAHDPELAPRLLGALPMLGLVAAWIVTFAGSAWASRRYLVRIVGPLLYAAARGQKQLNPDALELQGERFNAFAASLVMWSVLGYLTWMVTFVGFNGGIFADFPPEVWLPQALFGGVAAPTLFWLRIKVLSPQDLSSLRRYPFYQLVAAVVSVAAAIWLSPAGAGASEFSSLVPFMPLVAGAFLMIVWWAYANDQGLGRRADTTGSRPSPRREDVGGEVAEPASETEVGRPLQGHALFRKNLVGPGLVFVIHGHARDVRLELEKKLGEWGVRSITLQEEAAVGTHTILEHFERDAQRCDYAIALLTPDDTVLFRGADEEKSESIRQARPNVVFEIGWFLGKLGRDWVCLVKQAGTELPSNLDGVKTHEFARSLEEVEVRLRKNLEAWGLIG